MTELWFDAHDALVITADGSSVTVPEDDLAELMAIIADGHCAICLSEIPQDSKLCCSCLSVIFKYHKNHHACIR